MWLHRRKITKCLILIYLLSYVDIGQCEKSLRRQKRLAYPTNSCTGILVAVAIPLGLENRNVFVSWNFEGNYNMPTTAHQIIPGPLTRLELVDRRRSMGGDLTTGENHEKIKRNTDIRDREQIFSRNRIYQFLIKKLTDYNLDGKACLLRTICELAQNPLHEHNGIVGDLINVILTPSSTVKETGLPQKYYDAELFGRKGDCRMFYKACNVNVFDLFTNAF